MDKDLEQTSENARAVANSVISTLLWLNNQLILAEDEEAKRISDEVEKALRAVGVMKLAVDAWHPAKAARTSFRSLAQIETAKQARRKAKEKSRWT
jgi:hypothetical protein